MLLINFIFPPATQNQLQPNWYFAKNSDNAIYGPCQQLRSCFLSEKKKERKNKQGRIHGKYILGDRDRRKREEKIQQTTLDTHTGGWPGGFQLVFLGESEAKQKNTVNVGNIREATILSQGNNLTPQNVKTVKREKPDVLNHGWCICALLYACQRCELLATRFQVM